MGAIVDVVYNLIWNPVMIVFIIIVGVVFSFMTRFLQIRLIKDMVQQMFKGKSSQAGVSSFQAFAMALGNRVGTGNIAGVATAIAYGGPGSVFWMWVIAFFGAATAYVESTLGQIYKTKQDGEYRGGPAYYIENGIGWRWFGIFFAVCTAFSTAILMPGVQANAIASSILQAFSVKKWITGLFVIVLLGFIIFGGLKRIAYTAQLIVPFMSVIYILVALIIMIMNVEKIPEVFGLIFSSAFGANEVFGGILGSAVSWGVQRGVYSNEAGQGSGPHHSSAAEVSHPAKQGLVQAFSVYIDTLLVCSATAFIILFSGTYNVYHPDQETIYIQNIDESVEVGPNYTQLAIDENLSGFGSPFIAISLFLFAFTTIMAYYYMAEVNIAYLMRKRNKKLIMFFLKIFFLAATFYGTIREAQLAWKFGDIGVGLMVWINLIAIVILFRPAIQALKDYEEQKKAGLDPVYNSTKLGVKNADYWKDGYQGDNEEVS